MIIIPTYSEPLDGGMIVVPADDEPLASYGGRASRWVKKSSPRLEDDEGAFELHWYEHPGIGRVELKKKQVNQP
jgi:hypothetical protein